MRKWTRRKNGLYVCPVDNENRDITDLTISNLKPDTVYEFSVASINKNGQTTISASLEACTSRTAKPQPSVSHSGKPGAEENTLNPNSFIEYGDPGPASTLIRRFENKDRDESPIMITGYYPATIKDKTLDTVTLGLPYISANRRVHSYSVKFRKVSSIPRAWTEFHTSYQNSSTIVRSLTPHTQYEFLVGVVFEPGVYCPLSDKSVFCLTCPTSPPLDLRTNDVSKTSISIAWDKPIFVADGVSIKRYIITFRPECNNYSNACLTKETFDISSVYTHRSRSCS